MLVKETVTPSDVNLVMCLFNVPFPQENHALLSVQVGFKIQEVHADLMQVWKAKGVQSKLKYIVYSIPATPIGVGIATGDLIVGEIGCALRTDYTAIGRAANLGARICDQAPGGAVVISKETYELVRGNVDATELKLSLKGIGEVSVFHVHRIIKL